MTKFFNKWLRKFHRWIAVPTALAIPAAVVIKLVGDPKSVAAWERLDKIPSIYGDHGNQRGLFISTTLHCQGTKKEENGFLPSGK